MEYRFILLTSKISYMIQVKELSPRASRDTQEGKNYTCSAQEMPHGSDFWRLATALRRHESNPCSHSASKPNIRCMRYWPRPSYLLKANTLRAHKIPSRQRKGNQQAIVSAVYLRVCRSLTARVLTNSLLFIVIIAVTARNRNRPRWHLGIVKPVWLLKRAGAVDRRVQQRAGANRSAE